MGHIFLFLHIAKTLVGSTRYSEFYIVELLDFVSSLKGCWTLFYQAVKVSCSGFNLSLILELPIL